jgi:hypothetical protein
MKKITLFLTLLIAGLLMPSQAQNTYLNISNSGSNVGRLVIPNSATTNVTAAQSKTITFRVMIPSGSNNTTNFGKLMLKGDVNNVAGNGQYGITFGSATTPTPHQDMRLLSTSTVPVAYGNNNNTSLATTLNDGNWHHFALVLNDNTDPTGNPTSKSKLYYDGTFLVWASQSSVNQTGPIDMTSTYNLIFGATSTGGTPVKMAVDDIRIWDSAFTPAQVLADVSATIDAAVAPTTVGLLAAYDFQFPATLAVVTDITGKTTAANVGVNSSTTAFVTGPSTVLANKKFESKLSGVIMSLNATNAVLNISAPEATAAISVFVYDLSGKLINSTKSNDTNANVSLSNLSSGVYIASVTDGASSYTQKIIKN